MPDTNRSGDTKGLVETRRYFVPPRNAPSLSGDEGYDEDRFSIISENLPTLPDLIYHDHYLTELAAEM